MGRLDTFGELPATKSNPRQWNVVIIDREVHSLKYDNITAAANPDSKGKMWQDC